MTRFIVVPQWQGSPSPRAMQLIDGAEAIAGDLPRARTVFVEVPLEAGDALGSGIRRISALAQVRERLDDALAASDEPALVIGGDCSVSIGAIGHASEQCERLAVVWIDAHADLHDRTSSPSGAFGGMALRAVLGDAPDVVALPSGAVSPARVVLVGTRSVDDVEDDYIREHGVSVVRASDLSDPAALVDAVVPLAADGVYIHIDLDVLDPSEMPGVKSAEPFGATTRELVAAVKALRSEVPLVGATISEFIPASPDDATGDLGTILRLVGALA